MKECPKCGLVTPDSADRCDCGYDFRNGMVRSPSLLAKTAIRSVIKGVAGIAAVVWIFAPITPYNGFLAFAAASLVLLACFVALRLLDDDA
jgi:hypothetical protein